MRYLAFFILLVVSLLPGRVMAQPRLDTLRTSDPSVLILISEDNSWSLLQNGAPVDGDAVAALMDRLFPGRSHARPVQKEEKKESVETFMQSKDTPPATYKIRKGDTLSSIAKRHGTTVAKLCRLNGITETTVLSIGRTLKIR